jgi:hypothetical protein
MAAGDATRFADRLSTVPQNARMWILPVDGERFVDFDVLAGLDTAATKDALVRIVPVKRVRGVDLVRLLGEWDFLMIHREHLGRVVHRAVAVIVVADRAVKHMVLEQTVEGFALRGVSPGGFGLDLHPGGNLCRAGAPKLAVDLHHTSIARLNWAELMMVTHTRDLEFVAEEQIDEKFIGFCFHLLSIKD